MFNKDHKINYDEMLSACEVEPLYKTDEGKDRLLCSLRYIQNKAMFGFNSRDFLEKHIHFADKSEGRYYVYFSAVPKLKEIDPETTDTTCISENALTLATKPLPAKTDRGETFIGLQRIERRPSDNKIVYSMLL